MNNESLLFKITGLADEELAKTLINNPRAYMALKGAVAETHLSIYLSKLKAKGLITDFRPGLGDFEKDFYIKMPNTKKELALECKNVEVIKISNKKQTLDYFKYLIKNGKVEGPSKEKITHVLALNAPTYKEVKETRLALPLKLKESGLVRYEYSRYLANILDSDNNKTVFDKILAYEKAPLTIDFQRTRNSRDEEELSGKEMRFYKTDEIDLVAACIFSRTLSWDFIFYKASNIAKHNKHKNRYSNKLTLEPSKCYNRLIDCFPKKS